MRAVVQRTQTAKVTVAGETVAAIDGGLTVLLGVGREDTEADVQYLVEKITNLRIFSDAAGKMNLSLKEIQGELLVVSQFTLYGDCRKGRRPSFDAAAAPQAAQKMYELFLAKCRECGIAVQNGKFQAEMVVSLANDGPVTLILDSKRLL
jgi:D-tyrosyl-tRNA(Tyr) deacylase